jgi:hypothetical protein
MNHRSLRDLRKVLIELYPDEISIRRLLDDAGITSERVVFNSNAANTWHSVLVEAKKNDQLVPLLDVVKEEYGNNKEFQNAYDANCLSVDIEMSPLVTSLTKHELLKQLGFQPAIFDYLHADEMPEDMLQQTFVAHPQFKAYIMDLDNSAALLAPPGGGKTANRRLLELVLLKNQRNAFKHNLSSLNAPFTIVYKNFEMFSGRLQSIDLQDHCKPLLALIADKFIEVINDYPQLLTQLEAKERRWWWDLLNLIQGESVYHNLTDKRLIDDWQSENLRVSPLLTGNPLIDSLKKIQDKLAIIGFNKLYILVDGVDGFMEPTSISTMEAIIKPLVNTDELFSHSVRIWKFFLPDSLSSVIRNSRGRSSGRLKVAQIQWHENSSEKRQVNLLVDFLKLRLGWQSNYQEQNIQPLCTYELETLLENEFKVPRITIEESLALLSLRHKEQGPPRALLSFAEKLLTIAITQNKQMITLQDWEKFRGSIEHDLQHDSLMSTVQFGV